MKKHLIDVLLLTAALAVLFIIATLALGLTSPRQTIGFITPKHKPDQPLNSYQQAECVGRIGLNQYNIDQGSRQRIPVADYCNRMRE